MIKRYRLGKVLARAFLFTACCLLSACSSTTSHKGGPDSMLGQEYTDFARSSGSRSRPPSRPSDFWEKAALYLPNRVADAVDIVKADIGIGPSFGYVVRATRYGQFGYRTFSPMSIRAGIRGRKLPVFIERSSEFGIGPTFQTSHDREVTIAEVGAGIDVFLFGAYGGISLDECADFVLGFFGVDISDDDWQP